MHGDQTRQNSQSWQVWPQEIAHWLTVADGSCYRCETAMAKTRSDKRIVRCRWASNEWNIPYHDGEWGVPVHDDRLLFEFLILEGAQAGLSWDTILRKRERYREVFDNFDVSRVALYNTKKVRSLLADAGIIRNRLKIAATIDNARAFLKVQQEFGSFDKYIWQFVGGKPKRNQWKAHGRLPAKTAESDAMSKDLKKRGFRFVGSTICYAFMQATGMVNDHAVTCFRYQQIGDPTLTSRGWGTQKSKEKRQDKLTQQLAIAIFG